MNDETSNTEPRTIEHEAPKKAAGWPRWAAVGAVAFVALGGLGVAGAMSDDLGGPGRFMGAQMERMGWGGPGPRHGPHGPHGGPGEFFRIMGDLDLSKEQEDKLWTIAGTVRSEARPLMRDFRDAREQAVELLKADTVDRAAVEKLRTERVAAIDEASKKLTAALLDAAETLTPEQRTKLVDEMEDRGPGGRW